MIGGGEKRDEEEKCEFDYTRVKRMVMGNKVVKTSGAEDRNWQKEGERAEMGDICNTKYF